MKKETPEIDLAEAFAEKLNDPNLSKDYTWNDFFDEYGVPEIGRTDFAIAAILKQATEKYSRIKIKEQKNEQNSMKPRTIHAVALPKRGGHFILGCYTEKSKAEAYIATIKKNRSLIQRMVAALLSTDYIIIPLMLHE